MKRALCLLFVLLLLCAAAVSSYAYTVTDYAIHGDRTTVAVNSRGIYLVGFTGSALHAERVAPYGGSADLNLPYAVAAASVFGDTLVALCNDELNNQLAVYTCDLNSGIPDSFIIPSCTAGNNRRFYFDGSYLYLTDADAITTVSRYSMGGKRMSSFDFGVDAVILSGYGGSFCVLSGNRLYQGGGDSYTLVSGDTPRSTAAFIAEDLLLDSMGGVYRLNGSSASLLFCVKTDGSCAGAVTSDGVLYSACGTTLYRYDTAAGMMTGYFDAGCTVEALYASDGLLYALTDSASPSVLCLSPDEWIACPDETEPPVGLSPITSDRYTVDSVNYHITRIDAPTTFAQFKSHMRYEGYSVKLYRGNANLTSGNVGTAMQAVFSGEDDYTYELSVVGDITGEGSVNTRDRNELMDYFLGNIRFDGVYTDAADLSGDGKVDMLDLALLARRVAY